MKNIQRFSSFLENIRFPFKKETREEKWKRFFAEYELMITDLYGNKLDIATTNEKEFKIYYDPKKGISPYNKKLLIGVVRNVKEGYSGVQYLVLYFYIYKSVSDLGQAMSYFSYIDKFWQGEPTFGAEEELMKANEQPIGRYTFKANTSKPYSEQRLQVLLNTFNAWQATTIPGFEIRSSRFRQENN